MTSSDLRGVVVTGAHAVSSEPLHTTDTGGRTSAAVESTTDRRNAPLPSHLPARPPARKPVVIDGAAVDD